MTSEAESKATALDTVKLAVAAAILAGGIGAFYYFGDQATWIRVLALLVVAGIAVAVAVTSAPGRALWQFASDSRTEVRKVVWPSRQETIQTTLIVIVVVLIMGIFLWLVDLGLMAIVRALTGQGG